MTTHEAAVAEFRDASAAVRLAFSARDQAREAQIIANRRYAETSEALLAAQDRLETADVNLQQVQAEPPVAADIDTTTKPFGLRFNEVFATQQAPSPNGAARDAETGE